MIIANTKPTLLSVPGGSGICPTGPLVFKDDYPGLFIRGDSCLDLLPALEKLRGDCLTAKVPFPHDLEEIIKMLKATIVST